ncbi:MAG: SDR family oxidoreductase [Acidimicrobiia bacterium]|nr:SDR family oxidoreductase [Acidimicrobiia bacterium]
MGLTGEPSIWDGAPPAPEHIRLDGRTAIVTGAARGIGEAIATGLARFGADVAICDREAEDMAATATDIAAQGRAALTGLLDVRDEDAVAAFVADVADAFGSVDILVNNAGGGFNAAFLDVSAKGENALIRENFTSVTSFIRHTVPHMTSGGSIINVTSIEAHRAGPGFAIYSAMKAGVASLSQSLSMELAGDRIRVNCIAVDVTPTPGDAVLADDSGAISHTHWASQTWPEMGSVHDSAAAAVFLASDLSRFITGSSLHVDGGNWAASGWKVHLDDGSFGL